MGLSDMAELELQKNSRSIGQVRRSHYLLENVDVIEVGFRKFNQLCYARGTEVQRLFETTPRRFSSYQGMR